MASLLSAADIQTFRDVIDDVHDTFKQPIIIVKHVKKTINTKNTSSNPLYNKQEGSVTEVEQRTTIYVRVKYFANAGDDEYVTNIQNKFPDADVRIKVSASDLNTINGAESLILHGQRFELAGEPIPIAPFGNDDYYAYYLNAVK